jgi:hypothetical protein
VLQCLAKDPKQRPQTARELGNRLAEIQEEFAWNEGQAKAWWLKHQPLEV